MSPQPETGPVTVRLSGVSIHTNHGVSEAEREIGQRMVFDVELVLDRCEAVESDALEDTVDYGAVTEVLVESATSHSYLTLERLCAVTGGSLLESFRAVESVRVRATKTEPPIPVVMDGASVEVELTRGVR